MIFEMSYHSNGAFNHDIVYELPVPWRRYYYNKLIETKKQEQEQMNEEQRKAKSKGKRK